VSPQKELVSILEVTSDVLLRVDTDELYNLGSQIADLIDTQGIILGNTFWERLASLGSELEDAAESIEIAENLLDLLKTDLSSSS
jgi:hypothetical protein